MPAPRGSAERAPRYALCAVRAVEESHDVVTWNTAPWAAPAFA
jgi:hypothetical protein